MCSYLQPTNFQKGKKHHQIFSRIIPFYPIHKLDLEGMSIQDLQNISVEKRGAH